MIEPTEKEIDGMKFYFHPLPAFTAAKMDARVLALLAPILGGLKDLNLNASIDTETMARGASEALIKLSEGDLEEFAMKLLSATTYFKEGTPTPIEITTELINMEFKGKLQTLYKLLFAVMKYNKFSPFVLGTGGKGILAMFTSSVPEIKGTKSGKKSEMSENSQEK